MAGVAAAGATDFFCVVTGAGFAEALVEVFEGDLEDAVEEALAAGGPAFPPDFSAAAFPDGPLSAVGGEVETSFPGAGTGVEGWPAAGGFDDEGVTVAGVLEEWAAVPTAPGIPRENPEGAWLPALAYSWATATGAVSSGERRAVRAAARAAPESLERPGRCTKPRPEGTWWIGIGRGP